MEAARDIRFFKKVAKSKGCWTWTAAINNRGYGKFSLETGKWSLAHRASWLIHYGKIPKGLHVLHRCDNPPCVRPDHLFLGTGKDNFADMIDKGRQNYGNRSRGEEHVRSIFTEEEVLEIRALRSGGFSLGAIAEAFMVRKSAVSHIIQRRCWKHI